MDATEGDGVTFGDIEREVRDAVDGLGELGGVQGALAQIAYCLARALDAGAEGMTLSATAKELRETLKTIKEAADAGDAASKLESFLSTPVGDAADAEPADARP